MNSPQSINRSVWILALIYNPPWAKPSENISFLLVQKKRWEQKGSAQSDHVRLRSDKGVSLINSQLHNLGLCQPTLSSWSDREINHSVLRCWHGEGNQCAQMWGAEEGQLVVLSLGVVFSNHFQIILSSLTVKKSQQIHLGLKTCLKEQIHRREKGNSRNELSKAMLIFSTDE